MTSQIKGDTRGLAASDLKAIERLQHRRLDRSEIVSLDIARELSAVATRLSRRIGILISREGHIEEVVVGSKEILYLPDLGRYRLGPGRLRRLRLIFSDLTTKSEQAQIPQDIYTDLEKLRLDAVVSVKQVGNQVAAAYAYNVPLSDSGATLTEHVEDLGRLDLDFSELIESVENELERNRDRTVGTDKDRAVLVGVYSKQHSDPAGSMAELAELARTAGVKIVDQIVQRRDLDPKMVIGKGKLEEVVLRCLRLEANIVIFDLELRPGQWRAITNNTELKVLDRSMLILDIFAQRATSNEGKLQVELAQLKYNLPRLVEFDAGLSRLSGGIGGRGPGETKLEIGRRRIRDRISDLERRIDKLGAQRDLRKKRRTESALPLVSILGYTNVGKSTLFNALTKADVLVENKLFATLDPAQRRRALPGFVTDNPAKFPAIVFSDTVGFIRELPEELRTAFRATLEELRGAALLLHVVDASDPQVAERKAAVDQILTEMELGAVPQIVVLNKIDAADGATVARLTSEWGALTVSALTGENLDRLLQLIGERFYQPVAAQNQIEVPG